MTAVVTAGRVLSWAAEQSGLTEPAEPMGPAEPTGPLPAGPLWEPAGLASPPVAVRDAAAQLARRTAALLGAGTPPFGEHGTVGLGVVFLAAAAGGRRQAAAAALLAQAVPPPSPHRDPPGAWYDLIARHGLVTAVVRTLDGAGPGAGQAPGTPGTRTQGDDEPEPVQELLLAASPLTAVLHRPPLRALRSGTTGQAVATAARLLTRPRGHAVVSAGLARWSPLPQVLSWRADLLARLRHEHADLLLDVYLTARIRFGAEWDEQLGRAVRRLSAPTVADPLAVATVRFWAPLAALERASAAPLALRRPLLSGQDRALAAVRRFRLDQAGAA
jgi:hypothetical protein